MIVIGSAIPWAEVVLNCVRKLAVHHSVHQLASNVLHGFCHFSLAQEQHTGIIIIFSTLVVV